MWLPQPPFVGFRHPLPLVVQFATLPTLSLLHVLIVRLTLSPSQSQPSPINIIKKHKYFTLAQSIVMSDV
jgi:hypothetical protein